MEQKTDKTRWQRFIETYQSKSTIDTYKSSIKRFFQHIYGEQANLEASAEKYFTEDRDHKEDVRSFFVSIKDRPPKTVATWLAAVKTFLIENDVELPQKFWRKLKRRKKGSKAVTVDKVPSNKQLRQILTHMRAMGKALFLMLSSSGMRIGEALQLKLDDMHPDATPTQIDIRGEYTKSGNKRTVFISSEATEALKEWLKIRESKLQTAVGRSRGLKPKKDDDRVFPYTRANIYPVWYSALDKAKLNEVDESTNRHKIHPHVLRKFFRGQMGTVIPVDVVEALMGHEGYLTEVYRRYPNPEKTLAEYYQKGEASILIFTEAGEVEKLKQEVEERNKQLQTVINGLATENVEQKKKIRNLESDFYASLAENKGYRESLEQLKKQYQELYEVVMQLMKEKQ